MQIYLIFLNNKSLKWKILPTPITPPQKKIPYASNEDRCQYLGLFVVLTSETRMIIRDHVCILH